MKKILVIDDDIDLVEAVTNLLESRNYKVVSANDGDEGFALALKEKPDLMLLDVMMTNKTEGFSVARKIQDNEETRNIPIIMVTGIRKDMNLPFSIQPDSEWLPVKCILEKPVKPEMLLKAVSENIK